MNKDNSLESLYSHVEKRIQNTVFNDLNMALKTSNNKDLKNLYNNQEFRELFFEVSKDIINMNLRAFNVELIERDFK